MATLDDRILGEKLQYYCSSSEDENESDDDESGLKKEEKHENDRNEFAPKSFGGSSANTGPKGVIKDWQRFKQLQTEQRREQEKERILLAKKLALSCRSHADDEKADLEDVDGLIDDDILQQFIAQRMKEMQENCSVSGKKFGELLLIKSGEDFLDVVDHEDKNITVIVHLFESTVSGCDRMNRCLKVVAAQYPRVKFCCFQASEAGLSRRFQGTGVPAILVYKNGEMVANFVRLMDEFSEDFTHDDVASFLAEHGILHDEPELSGSRVIRSSSNVDDDDSE